MTLSLVYRQNPGQYEYYKNYDDLEVSIVGQLILKFHIWVYLIRWKLIETTWLFQIHFRRGHFLCEDEGCLAKKFIVFLSEGELKVSYLCAYAEEDLVLFILFSSRWFFSFSYVSEA